MKNDIFHQFRNSKFSANWYFSLISHKNPKRSWNSRQISSKCCRKWRNIENMMFECRENIVHIKKDVSDAKLTLFEECFLKNRKFDEICWTLNSTFEEWWCKIWFVFCLIEKRFWVHKFLNVIHFDWILLNYKVI